MDSTGRKNALNRKTSINSAYNLGRLYAVLDWIISDGNGTPFTGPMPSSAVQSPAYAITDLIRRSNSRLNCLRLQYPKQYKKKLKLLCELMDLFEDHFPNSLSNSEQGSFFLGCFQQYEYLLKEK